MNDIKMKVEVNGVVHERVVEPRLLLVDFLRDELGLTGTHIGCEEGICGACTVVVNGEIVKSCLMFAVQADGSRIVTIEGVKSLEDGNSSPAELHAIQQAFIETGAIQCGYCTPGMVLTAWALLKENQHPREDDIRSGLLGNLCRCGSYQKIFEAIKRASVAV
jgi:aerobic-type carbon monoxide dehydrogenase small subunit (CoxS/CutS family)